MTSRVFFAENAMIAHHMKALFEAAGISAAVTGETLAAMAGIGPVDLSVQPAVWVHDPRDYERAIEIIRRYESHEPADGHAPRPDWSCPGCDESIDGAFGVCWNCGTSRLLPEQDQAESEVVNEEVSKDDGPGDA